MMQSKKIIVCPNPYKDNRFDLSTQVAAMLQRNGYQTVMCPVFVGEDGSENAVDLDKLAEDAVMLVAVGGDGTFLQVARAIMGRDVPLIGINMGTKGFLAELEPQEAELLLAAAEGRFQPSRRMLLDVKLIRDGKVLLKDLALNDAVIKCDVNAIGLSVMSDDVTMSEYSGDGVIVSTPTGSTAYSMSAGGPIVEPRAQAIVVTPICAHDLAVRSFVLSPERMVKVLPSRMRGRRAMLSVDGSEPVEVHAGDVVQVSRSEKQILIADMGINNFFDMTRSKLTANNRRERG